LNLVLIVILCLWLSAVVWEGRNLTPLFLEKIISGFYNSPDLNCGLDNLYHMSMAQMIKTYHIPSTGLDELPYTPYHFGSHFLFAQISTVLGISIVDMYHVGFPIIFVPLFFYVVFLVFHQFKELSGSTALFDYFFWVLSFALFIGILPVHPEGIAFRTSLAWNSILKSESYLISMLFFVMSLSFIIVPILKEGSMKTSPPLVLFSIFLLIMIGICKLSTLFILDVVLGYLYFRYRLYKSVLPTLFLISAAAISFFLIYLVNDPKASGGGIEFLHFYKNFIHSRFPFFIFLSFLWTFLLLAIGLFLAVRKIRVNTILVELQIAIAVFGFLPGMVLQIAGGSAYYFSDIQHWTALFFIAYYLNLSIPHLKKRGLLLVYGFALLAVIAASLNSLYSWSRLWKDNYITKRCIQGTVNFNQDLISIRELISQRSVLFDKSLKTKLMEHEDFSKVTFLISLNGLEHKEAKILYVEDENTLSRYFPCYKFPFFVAATTGMSLFRGYSLRDCYWGGYGVEYYDKDRTVSKNENICELLNNPTFRAVVSINIAGQSQKVTACNK
jgi:hypothetical protein